jgi:hypothetical protein
MRGSLFVFRIGHRMAFLAVTVVIALQYGLYLPAADAGGKSLVLSEEELQGDVLEKRAAQEESLAFGGSP